MIAKIPDSDGKNESSDIVFNLLGIRALNKVIMATIGKAVLKVSPREKMPSYFVGRPFETESLLLTRKWLLFNQIVHSFLIVFCAGIGYYFFERGYIDGVLIIFSVILLNLALILMQIMNRNRIKRTIIALRKRKLA